MRTFVILIALFISAARTPALESETFSINQYPVPAEALVSFSIGYPKSWRVSDDSAYAWHDIYNDIAYSPHTYGPICSFLPRGEVGSLKSHSIVSYMIWPAGDSMAKEAAENFIGNKSARWPYIEQSLSPIKTSTGDSGWLVESKGVCRFYTTVVTNSIDDFPKLEKNNSNFEKIPIIYHDFFFRSGNSHGNKEAIHIQTVTRAADSSIRSELDHLVLQTLRFSDAR